MTAEGRRTFVAQLGAGAGLLVLGSVNGCSSAGSPARVASSTPAESARPEAPSFEAVLHGSVLALRYRYAKALGERLIGPPWAATLVVAVEARSAYPTCRSLARGALRTEAPSLEGGVVHAAAEVDVVAFLGLQPPLVCVVHASFLHLRSDALRLAATA